DLLGVVPADGGVVQRDRAACVPYAAAPADKGSVGRVVAHVGVVQRDRAAIVNAAAIACRVVAHVGVVQRERASIRDTTPRACVPITYAQAGDADRGTRRDREDGIEAAGVAPHRQLLGPGALEVDVAAEVRQDAAQVDGAGDRQGDRVVPGLRVGLGDAVAQVAGQAGSRAEVGQAIDRVDGK